MKRFLWIIVGWVSILILSGPVFIEFGKSSAKEESVSNAEKPEDAIRIRVSDLMGEKIRNKDGDEYGTLGDMILHKDGTIDYAILLHGGILGLGKSLIPIPWSRVLDTENEGVLVIDVDDELIENAPNFSEEEWDKFGNDEWNKEIEKYYRY
ncbi:MAG: PRC-barrel domain-containing protein [Thermodesulfobacteriota bacterium]